MNSIHVNGLPLPNALVAAINTGRWRTPTDRSVWLSLFPAEEIVQPALCTFSQTSPISDPWLAEAGPCYHGKCGEGYIPGNIDPAKTVVIGDLGPDRLLALDYRQSLSEPQVIGLTSEHHSNWRTVAENIEVFLRAIRLTE